MLCLTGASIAQNPRFPKETALVLGPFGPGTSFKGQAQGSELAQGSEPTTSSLSVQGAHEMLQGSLWNIEGPRQI